MKLSMLSKQVIPAQFFRLNIPYSHYLDFYLRTVPPREIYDILAGITIAEYRKKSLSTG
jgi:hypothetical protein